MVMAVYYRKEMMDVLGRYQLYRIYRSRTYQLLERESLGNDEVSSHYQQWPSHLKRRERIEGGWQLQVRAHIIYSYAHNKPIQSITNTTYLEIALSNVSCPIDHLGFSKS